MVGYRLGWSIAAAVMANMSHCASCCYVLLAGLEAVASRNRQAHIKNGERARKKRTAPGSFWQSVRVVNGQFAKLRAATSGLRESHAV